MPFSALGRASRGTVRTGVRLRLYTRTGDAGETGLLGGGRVGKSDRRVEALGAIDELNASIGRALAGLASERAAERLALIQNDLFVLGSHVAQSDRLSGGGRARLPALPASRPRDMEAWIDESQAELPPLRAFIVPGGSRGAGELHLTRAVCRRAERRVVALGDAGAGAAFAVRYLNRLSDLLFVLARHENQAAGAGDVLWRDASG